MIARAPDPFELLARFNGHALKPVEPVELPAPPVVPVVSKDAYHGLLGDIVRTIDPHTEADPVAVATNLIVMAGSAFGRSPHIKVGRTRHGTNLYKVDVGETAKGRKGTSLAVSRGLLVDADPEFGRRIVSGLSSGEGLIHAVRDPIERQEPQKEKGVITGYQTVVADPGVEDKRLLVIEQEFASTLKAFGRDGNTGSAVIRDAWDGNDLQILTRNSPARATAPHISVIAHVTREELLRNLSGTETTNGFANRFLMFWVRRSKLLPEGGALDEVTAQAMAGELAASIAFARRTTEVKRNAAARELWATVYADLSAETPGLVGSLTARAEAQVLRLSLIYALLDRSPEILPEHLYSALALWEFSEASVRFIFGDKTGNPDADRILTIIRERGAISQAHISDELGRNVSAARIGHALETLQQAGLISGFRDSDTGGRPRTMWAPVATTQEGRESSGV